MQSDNQLLVSEMQKKLGVTSLVSEIKSVESYPDFEKLAHVIQHGLRGFIVKNNEGKSTEANNVRHILYKWVCTAPHTYIHTYIQPLFKHDKNIKANKLVGSCTK